MFLFWRNVFIFTFFKVFFWLISFVIVIFGFILSMIFLLSRRISLSLKLEYFSFDTFQCFTPLSFQFSFLLLQFLQLYINYFQNLILLFRLLPQLIILLHQQTIFLIQLLIMLLQRLHQTLIKIQLLFQLHIRILIILLILDFIKLFLFR